MAKSEEGQGAFTEKYILSSERFVKVKIFCPKERIGHVYGRIKCLRKTTKCRISVNLHKKDEETYTYIITLTAFEVCEYHSPVEDAAFALLPICVDKTTSLHRICLLLDNKQFDCVVKDKDQNQRRWEFISEAQISLSEEDYVVEIVGGAQDVKKAFTHLILNLRKEAFLIQL